MTDPGMVEATPTGITSWSASTVITTFQETNSVPWIPTPRGAARLRAPCSQPLKSTSVLVVAILVTATLEQPVLFKYLLKKQLNPNKSAWQRWWRYCRHDYSNLCCSGGNCAWCLFYVPSNLISPGVGKARISKIGLGLASPRHMRCRLAAMAPRICNPREGRQQASEPPAM